MSEACHWCRIESLEAQVAHLSTAQPNRFGIRGPNGRVLPRSAWPIPQPLAVITGEFIHYRSDGVKTTWWLDPPSCPHGPPQGMNVYPAAEAVPQMSHDHATWWHSLADDRAAMALGAVQEETKP